MIEMGLVRKSPRPRPSERNNCLAASDADCSNAAFFIAHPFAPQFPLSHALLRSSRGIEAIGRVTDTDARRKRRPASAIIKPELAVVSDCSIDRTVTHPPKTRDRPLRKPRRSPPTGVSLYSRL